MKTKKIVLYGVIIFIVLFIFIGTWWVNDYCTIYSLEQVLFHLKVPLNRMNNDIINNFLLYCLPIIVVLTAIMMLIIKKFKKLNTKYLNICLVILFCLSILYSYIKFDLYEFFSSQLTYSSFIEENYVNPKEVDMVFPTKKKNLIYIYLESMENTYLEKEMGGASDKKLIPNLTNLLEKNISFSNSDLYGGAYQYDGTSWTMAGLVASTAGIPIKVSLFSKKLDGTFNNVYTLGEILNDNGYNQTFLIGSDSVFGGRKSYFMKHGNYKIMDYQTMIDNGNIPSDYYVWWGYEDKKLFEYAKKELLDLSSKAEPFNLTVLTVDTHFVGGYLDSNCELKYDDQFSNVLYCSDKLVYDFVEWISKQDFYDDTTIVITGDHLTMDKDYVELFNYDERTIYNVFINSSLTTTNNKNRVFSMFDIFPTTLASMGVKIEGERLGLGTNLFSDIKTYPEMYSNFNDELTKTSKYYNSMFLTK